MQISGLQKTTLLDYPGHLAATIFLGGCNFRCPFCHNKDLVLQPGQLPAYSEEEILTFLKKRQGILEGVCITGGEPTLSNGLMDFIKEIKKLSYLVKLDTNGTNPELIDTVLQHSLVDYIAMDIKTDRLHYNDIANFPVLKIEDIDHSISSIKNSGITYEFRTTVVKEFHTEETFLSIGEWIGDCHLYALQPYKDSENILMPGCHTVTKDVLLTYQKILSSTMHSVIIRATE